MSHLLRLLIAVTALIVGGSTSRAEVRIKDITTVEGARGNQLYGVGLVVGLNNTGARNLSTQQMAIDMLRKVEMSTTIARQSLLDNVFKSTSISKVWVTAELPEFARKGSKLDVVVSVLDDATSLEGGTLVLTPLRGADGEVYAVAQGQVSIGGFRVRGANNGQLNHPTVGRIQGGAFVERAALGEINQNGLVQMLLRDPDYSTSAKISEAINERFPGASKTVDAGTVQIRIPAPFTRRVTEFVGEVGLISVMPDTAAKVVINERTGTVIVGHNVRVSAVAIAHGNLVIKPNMSVVSPPAAGGAARQLPNPPSLLSPPKEEDERFGSLPVPPAPDDKPQTFHRIDQSYTVSELARILNALGVSPRDLISIFESLKDSGALHAELVIK
ncbi:MAG: flagellar P-ring protein (basal body P-ring protein) [Planctomycetota bacterium]|nr:MAG: flagellar P-ring protein (basal body P-ring protein) [Planctomycetota bacterium]